MWAVFQPSSSIWRSTWSASTAELRNQVPAWGPPLWPAIVGANTS